MPNHTPGPWSIDSSYGAGQRVVVKGRPGFSGDYRVADAHFSSDLANCVRVPEMQANARLIAAAPELLDAVKAVLDWYGGRTNHPKTWSECMLQARDALAKAEKPDA